jgi:hypothetical protein
MKFRMFLNYKENFVVIGILGGRARRLGMVVLVSPLRCAVKRVRLLREAWRRMS